MELNFENLLYDHSLHPQRRQPKDTGRGEKSGYPGEAAVIEKLSAVSNGNAGYKLGNLHFLFRYRSSEATSFGGLPDTFLSCPNRLLVIAIQKKKDDNKYSVALVKLNVDRDYSKSWSINQNEEKWSNFLPLDVANKKIAEWIAEEANKAAAEEANK